MGGIDVGGGKGGRRALDSEVNMIPFIDLLMVTISFLLITAVWTHMTRIAADAQVPGPPNLDEPTPVEPEKRLHVEMQSPDKFVLSWKQGANVISSVDVPRKDNVVVGPGGTKSVHYPELAQKIEAEWKNFGSHRDPSDKKFDTAILHTDNETPFVYMIGVIDAIYSAHRGLAAGGSKVEQVPAFNVTFAVN
ncbi:MAG: biopolymer transporter ExbD [Polyangiaceae bacterium]|nr:biopolymer transporter ExbD [Polyangiaceae bacterium]